MFHDLYQFVPLYNENAGGAQTVAIQQSDDQKWPLCGFGQRPIPKHDPEMSIFLDVETNGHVEMNGHGFPNQ